MNHTTETSQKFLTEAALILRQNGYQAEHLPDGQLEVFYDEQRLCRVRPNAGIIYRSEDITSPERLDAKDTVCEIVQAVSEYVRQMERAPALKIKGIQEQIEQYLPDIAQSLKEHSFLPSDLQEQTL